MYTKPVNRCNDALCTESLQIVDERGRLIGLRIATWESDMVQHDEAWGSTIAPGHWFFANVQSTRNGACFGASQYDQNFHSEEARRDWIEKRIRDTQRRYVKKMVKA